MGQNYSSNRKIMNLKSFDESQWVPLNKNTNPSHLKYADYQEASINYLNPNENK
jgi:hypothetical protein